MASLAAPDSPLLKLADIQSDKANSAERLAGCLNAIINLQRSAATSREFFGLTAKALVEQIGLNRGLVLLKRKNRWMVEARFPDIEYEGSGREFSTSVLARLEEDRKTYFSDSTSINSFESLVSVKAVVASPILDQKGMVTGAIYGIRDKGSSGSEVVIGSLEAQMVQLLASTVAVGMARLETAANFEAFFGLELALELEKNPALLAGQEREISVLFADIRGFSRLSQMLGPIETCKLVSDIMERLSKCVRDQQGVIVSYMGDGIIAMWNAPQEQPDHALRAVRAGMAMITCLGETNNTWSGKVGNLRVGVGVSSGPALCGNTGSSFKFQYGPLGNTVNVASRVEGATKHFGVNMLLTGTTKAHLPDLLPMRRIRKVRLVGIPEPVELYEVSTPGSISESLEFRTQYEQALKHYEDGRHLEAVRTLQAILANHADPDGPTLALLIRAVAALGHVEQGSPIENMANK
jgi:adenylate cyclase